MRFPRLFRAFLEWCLPDLARHIDFGFFELVNKERFTVSGAKREGDVLVKTRLHGSDAAFLFHLENQGQVQQGLPDRILEYVVLDRRECAMEVYPIVLVTCHWPEARKLSPLISDFPNKRVLYFDFSVVLLDEMLAADHVRSRNPAALALVGAMRMDRQERATIAVRFLESMAAVRLSEEEREIVLAFFFGHLRLDREERLQVRSELDRLDPMLKDELRTIDNPLIEWGLERGRQEGEASVVLRLLKKRFGPIPAAKEAAIKGLPAEKLEELAEAVLDFGGMDQVERWLAANA